MVSCRFSLQLIHISSASAWQQLKSSWTMLQIFSRESSSRLANISWLRSNWSNFVGKCGVKPTTVGYQWDISNQQNPSRMCLKMGSKSPIYGKLNGEEGDEPESVWSLWVGKGQTGSFAKQRFFEPSPLNHDESWEMMMWHCILWSFGKTLELPPPKQELVWTR